MVQGQKGMQAYHVLFGVALFFSGWISDFQIEQTKDDVNKNYQCFEVHLLSQNF
jgi:hypothetical protein